VCSGKHSTRGRCPAGGVAGAWACGSAGVVHHGPKHGRVVGVGGGEHHGKGQAASVAGQVRLVPCLPRSTGFAPVSAPFDRADAGGVDQDPLQLEAAGLAQFVQQHRLELLEHLIVIGVPTSADMKERGRCGWASERVCGLVGSTWSGQARPRTSPGAMSPDRVARLSW